ncbi:kinase-like protein [Aspergillus coremiiformis]|uniref:Kinase-like protein n=1 Tax=Aspergillus coremiiformis TaxID=138285 RepID=A0A5N6Z7W8_9EURO|nr:kinase-like protein [Aspergillus coremiiformis]
MDRRISPSDLTNSNRFVPDSMINVFRVDEKTVVKLCDPTRLAEAEALRFIRSKTSLPVPEVYSAYVDESIDRGVIVMEYIEGDVLRDVIEEMDDKRRERIALELQKFMSELRSFEGNFIGSIDGSACEDPVFCAEQGGFGPYRTEKEFNDGLIRAMTMNQNNSWSVHVAKLIQAMPSHKIVLTHADFSPRNIIVRGDQVVGIVDWEMAGFYPEYWEYIKAMYHPDWQSCWVNDGTVDIVLKPFYLEHAVMLHMQEVVW